MIAAMMEAKLDNGQRGEKTAPTQQRSNIGLNPSSAPPNHIQQLAVRQGRMGRVRAAGVLLPSYWSLLGKMNQNAWLDGCELGHGSCCSSAASDRRFRRGVTS